MMSTPLTLSPATVSWAERAWPGRTVHRQLQLHDQGRPWPGVSTYQQGMIFDRSDWLDATRVAAVAEARDAVATLQAAFVSLLPDDLPAPTTGADPGRGMLRFESPFVDAGVAARFVALPLRGASARPAAFVDAVRTLADLVQRESASSVRA